VRQKVLYGYAQKNMERHALQVELRDAVLNEGWETGRCD
jgi:hypothetical protein